MNFKKLAVTLSIIGATSICTVPRSEAIVGVVSWNPPLMGIGLAAASLGTVIGIGVGAGAEAGLKSGNVGLQILGGLGAVVAFGGCLGAMLGMIVLEDGTESIVYHEITPKMQNNLKLSNDEVKTFNGELDQVNFITTQVALDLSKMTNPTAEDSKKAWEEYSDMVSKTTFTVMGKIAKTMFVK